MSRRRSGIERMNAAAVITVGVSPVYRTSSRISKAYSGTSTPVGGTSQRSIKAKQRRAARRRTK